MLIVTGSIQNTQVSEAKEFRKPYFRESENRNEFKDASFSIWCYRGAVAEPRWKDVDTGSFSPSLFSFFPLTW